MEWKEKIDSIISEFDIDVNDVLDYWYEKGLINSPERTKRKQGGIGWEELSGFQLNKIDSDLKTPNLDIEDKTHLFYNKKIVITGVFENFAMRKTMAKMIKDVGGDKAGPSKMKKIKELGIKTLTENEFIELFK